MKERKDGGLAAAYMLAYIPPGMFPLDSEACHHSMAPFLRADSVSTAPVMPRQVSEVSRPPQPQSLHPNRFKIMPFELPHGTISQHQSA